MGLCSTRIILLLATVLLFQCRHLEAICYFPQEFQGDFMMQSTGAADTGIQYGTVNVTATSIPIWGNCHKRIGTNNFILMLNFAETTCVRCLHLKLRSSNVLQVFALNERILSTCYTNEKLAEANCPSEESLAKREAAEILLFKIRDAMGTYTKKDYCPIDGKFFVNYRSNDAKKENECSGSGSSMNSCPSGSTLNFRLRGCTSDSHDLKFECLGSWDGPKNQRYLIFTDNRRSNGHTPQYRCALYSHIYSTGDIHMALSRDSTCSNGLHNSTSGFETFVLSPKGENAWPPETSLSICSFPKWMNGNWEHVRVDDDTMIYKDHSSFKTYTIKCVGSQDSEDKFLIFSRTQCDEERYNCMRILKRSNNILEFQLGSNASNTKDVFVLCADENFQNDSWITQGRTDVIEDFPDMSVGGGKCPISGEYTGVIPDSENLDLCAKLWSDCSASELMYYQVSHCQTKEIYEEREYRCLGHWKESEYLYTYTQRRDVAAGTYECFVGVKISDNKIYIKEAGEHCQRNIDPLRYGMKLDKTGNFTCQYTTPRRPAVVKTTTLPTNGNKRPSLSSSTTTRTTTKLWNFDIGGAETKDNEFPSTGHVHKATYFVCTLLFVINLYL